VQSLTKNSRRVLVAAGFLLSCAVLVSNRAHAQQAQPEEGEQIDEVEQIKVPADLRADAVRPDLSRVAEQIFNLTNQFRIQNKLPELAVNEQLAETAQAFANHMAKTDRYGHAADGRRPPERAKAQGYEFCIVSENIAYQYRSTGFKTEELAARLVEGWKNSPEHRKNMLDPDVTQFGVALARSEKTDHYYAVQMFGRPQSQGIDFAIVNQSEEALNYQLAGEKFELPPRYTRRHQLCRPAQLTLQPVDPQNGGKSAPPKPIEPVNGTRYLITSSRDGIAVQQERLPPQAEPKSPAPAPVPENKAPTNGAPVR